MKRFKTHKQLISEKELITIADKIVYKYNYVIPKREMEDTKMSLISNYLSQEAKIHERFEGNSKATTYVMAILNRMCCSIIRKEKKHWFNDKQTSSNEELSSTHETTANSTIIKDEINYLTKIIKLLNDTHKTIVFMAYLDKLETKENCVKAYDTEYQKHNTLNLLANRDNLSKTLAYNQLSLITNTVEKKDIGADAVRMWLNKQEKSIIDRLNGPFNRANYNKESYYILFDLFYNNI